MLKEIQQKTATKRGERASHQNSPVPSIDIQVYNDNEFPNRYSDIIVHRSDNKREAVSMRHIETQANPDKGYIEKLWYGVSSTGWLIYAYWNGTNIEYTKCFDSGDIFNTLAQYKEKFG
jgi:hypothetical protein